MARIIFHLEDGTELNAELLADTITIGRDRENDIVLPSKSVSLHHATIKFRRGSYIVMNHGDTNGTKINGVEIDEAILQEGDRLFFGDIAAVFRLREASAKKTVSAESDSEEPAAPAAKSPARPKTRRGSNPAAVTKWPAGCARFIMILVFLAMAFVTGLCIRHLVAHPGRFLLTDVAQVLHDRLAPPGPVAPVKKEAKDPKPEE